MGYGDSDYDPVGIYDDEEEQLRRAGYAPAMPSAATDAAAPPPVESSYAPAAPSRAPEPAVGSLDDLESRAAHPSYPAVAADQPQRPQWKDYAPAEPHGWSKFGHFMAGLTAPTDYFFNERPLEQATRGYKAATAEYEAPFAEREKESQTAEHEAAAERDRATAAAAGQPKPKEEKWGAFTGYTDVDGTPLLHEENSGQTVRADNHQPPKGFKVAAPKSDRPDTPEQQFIDEYQRTHPNASVASAVAAYSAATQKPEHEPKQLAVAPDGTVVELRPGAKVPAGTRTLSSELKGPTADEERRADLARNMNENLDQLEEIVKRRGDLFGPGAGRLTQLRSWVGTGDKDIAALNTIKEMMGMAQVGAHAMKNAQHVETAANSILNAFHNKPDAILEAINKARGSVATFQQDAGEQPGSAPKNSKGEQEKTLSEAAIEKAAKDHNITVDEAKKQAKAQGYKVQ
jgi:hypothetical protein